LAASRAADCETLEAGTKSASGLERQRQLLGMPANDEVTDVIQALFDRYWQVRFPEKMERCPKTSRERNGALHNLKDMNPRSCPNVLSRDWTGES
jgi:hypothetical protein